MKLIEEKMHHPLTTKACLVAKPGDSRLRKTVILSERRARVMRCRAQGLSVLEISQRLGINPKTVYKDFRAVHKLVITSFWGRE